MSEGIDLSKIPAPEAVETLSAEQIVIDSIAELTALAPEFTALVESDPAFKQIQVNAYRETLIRAKINSSVNAVLLSSATGTDLDQLGANEELVRYPGAVINFTGGGSGSGAVATPVIEDGKIKSITIENGGSGYSPAPTISITGYGAGATATAEVSGGVVVSIEVTAEGQEYFPETDTAFRRRIQLSPEGYSTAGPRLGYIFHALNSDIRVKDANAYSDTPGVVEVVVLSTEGNGTASGELLTAVDDYVSAEERRPLTDNVNVSSAIIEDYTINVLITFKTGPDRTEYVNRKIAEAEAFIEENHRIRGRVTLASLYALFFTQGITTNVTIISPVADVITDNETAPYCSGLAVSDGGIVE